MKNLNKYVVLLVIFVVSIFALFYLIDVRGEISIGLDSEEYQLAIESIEKKALILKIFVVFFLTSVFLLIHKQFKNNKYLEEEVAHRTKEILSTKTLLQEVLDTDKSFLMVAEGKKIIVANKTMLDFFNVNSLEDFLKQNGHIATAFVTQEDKECLSEYVDGEHWVTYLNREQKNKDLKIMMSKDDNIRCFKPHTKALIIDNKELNIIIFDDITDELEKINSLEEKASRDDLTGLFNRGKFNDVLSRELALSKVTSSPLSIIFLDIDHFKIVNDTYGHEAGDYVLVELSRILETSVREGDFVARWGGEEFVVTLQSTNAKQASVLAEKIRLNVENYDFSHGGKQTISLGVTKYKENESQDEFVKRVDDALYEAKETGRNKVVMK